MYYLRIVTAAGTAAYVSTPCASIEAAMETASAVLRFGAIDAWVVDENENKVADFEAIKNIGPRGNHKLGATVTRRRFPPPWSVEELDACLWTNVLSNDATFPWERKHIPPG
jgi:hypothetical protein